MSKHTALLPCDMEKIKAAALKWVQKNQHVDPLSLPRTRRIWDEEARAAYTIRSVATKRQEKLSQPCIACGTWTLAWCEGCDVTSAPQPVCTLCDTDGLTCFSCRDAGKTYESSRSNGNIDMQKLSEKIQEAMKKST